MVEVLKRPKQSKGVLDDIVREWRQEGSTKNADAAKAAKILAKYAEAARIEANRAGANIGRLEGWGGPQSHDEALLLRAGKDQWVRDVLPALDLERSFGEGVDEAEAAQILSETWETIVTGQGLRLTSKEKGQRVGPANLARSLEKHRVLHFRDADSWLAYNDRYGRGNVFTGMIDHLHGMARTVSMMQAFGPNPQVMLESVLEAERRAIREGGGSIAQKQKRLAKLNADLDKAEGIIGRAFAEVMGDTFRPANLTAAKWGAGIRAVESMAKLGGAVISSVTDLVTYAHAMRFQGRGILESYAEGVGALFAGKSAQERRQISLMLGVGADAMLGDIHARYAAEDNMPGRISGAMNRFFKLSGLTWWTDRLTTTFASMSSAHMAEQSGKAWDQLDGAYRMTLESHGIGAERWEVVRKLTAKEGDYQFIWPDAINSTDDALIEPLVRGDLAKVDAGLAERVEKRQAQDQRQAEWVEKRVAKYQEKFARARQRLADRIGAIRQKQAERRAEVEARITEFDERLSELAELVANTSISERGAGRAEGRIGEKVKQAEAAIRRLIDDRDVKQAGLSADFERLWQQRSDELLGRVDAAVSEEKVVRGKTPNQRLAEFREAFGKARERLTERLDKTDAAAAERQATIEQRIGAYEEQLTSLDEAVSALRFSRRQIGRDEGRLEQRVKQAQRDLKKRDSEADAAAKELGAEFQRLWESRQDELTTFIDRMDEQAAERAQRSAEDVAYQPERIANIYRKARRNLELDLRAFFADEAQFGIIQADDRTRMFTTQGTRPGTALGEAIRFLMQFKSFPVAYTAKILAPALRGRGVERQRDWGGIAHLIAMSTLLGYVAMTAKDALKNRTPKDPTKYETILAAFAQGGGLGIYGDFLFGSADRFGGTLYSKLAGPAVGTGADIYDLYTKARSGDAGAGDAFWLALNNTPYANLWYTRAALDLAILNQIQEWISPGTLRRREKNIQRDFGQRYIVDPTPLQ